MRRDEVIRLIREHDSEIRAFGVRHLSLFGSVARDTAGPSSDVDVLVDFEAVPSFEQYMGLRAFLEDLLGSSIDLADRAALRARIRPRIEEEAIAVA